MTDSEKLLPFALESCRSDQLVALLSISEAKGVPLAELIDEAFEHWLAKELEAL